MVTLRCRKSGFEVEGVYVATTTDHYILEINGVTQVFRLDEWEVSDGKS